MVIYPPKNGELTHQKWWFIHQNNCELTNNQGYDDGFHENFHDYFH